VYIFCIFAFPWCHQQFHAVRNDINKIWNLTLFWLGMNYLYIAALSAVFFMDNDALKNYFAISSYVFPPGWFPCCACGVGKCYNSLLLAKLASWGLSMSKKKHEKLTSHVFRLFLSLSPLPS
jgi:hypothetical protein